MKFFSKLQTSNGLEKKVLEIYKIGRKEIKAV